MQLGWTGSHSGEIFSSCKRGIKCISLPLDVSPHKFTYINDLILKANFWDYPKGILIKMTIYKLFQEYMINLLMTNVPIIYWFAEQMTDFYMMGTLVIKRLSKTRGDDWRQLIKNFAPYQQLSRKKRHRSEMSIENLKVTFSECTKYWQTQEKNASLNFI